MAPTTGTLRPLARRAAAKVKKQPEEAVRWVVLTKGLRGVEKGDVRVWYKADCVTDGCHVCFTQKADITAQKISNQVLKTNGFWRGIHRAPVPVERL